MSDVYFPSWLLEVDTIFKSEFVGFKHAVELYDFALEMHNTHSSKCMQGALITGDVKLKIARGLYLPVLEERYAQNAVLKKITVSHMSTSQGEYKAIDVSVFKECVIQNIQHDMHFVEFSCMFVQYEHRTCNAQSNHACVSMSFKKGARV